MNQFHKKLNVKTAPTASCCTAFSHKFLPKLMKLELNRLKNARNKEKRRGAQKFLMTSPLP